MESNSDRITKLASSKLGTDIKYLHSGRRYRQPPSHYDYRSAAVAAMVRQDPMARKLIADGKSEFNNSSLAAWDTFVRNFPQHGSFTGFLTQELVEMMARANVAKDIKPYEILMESVLPAKTMLFVFPRDLLPIDDGFVTFAAVTWDTDPSGQDFIATMFGLSDSSDYHGIYPISRDSTLEDAFTDDISFSVADMGKDKSSIDYNPRSENDLRQGSKKSLRRLTTFLMRLLTYLVIDAEEAGVDEMDAKGSKKQRRRAEKKGMPWDPWWNPRWVGVKHTESVKRHMTNIGRSSTAGYTQLPTYRRAYFRRQWYGPKGNQYSKIIKVDGYKTHREESSS